MSHVSKAKVSPSLCRRLGALEDAHGTQAAITENKRLGDVQAYAKALQDAA